MDLRTMEIERGCAVCREDITVRLAEDGTILSGGAYFGRLLDGSEGEYWECEGCVEK